MNENQGPSLGCRKNVSIEQRMNRYFSRIPRFHLFHIEMCIFFLFSDKQKEYGRNGEISTKYRKFWKKVGQNM